MQASSRTSAAHLAARQDIVADRHRLDVARPRRSARRTPRTGRTGSRRPGRRRARGPAPGSAARPRGVIASTGTPRRPTLSIAAASTSARSTIPAPPPAGVSSTVRCLSVAKSRICIASSDHCPSRQRAPGERHAERPGKHLGIERQDGGGEGHCGGPFRVRPRMRDWPTMDDCIIIGARPRRADRGDLSRALPPFDPAVRLRDSRAALIPRTHNHAGYPDGIPGTDLLAADAARRRRSYRRGARAGAGDRDRARAAKISSCAIGRPRIRARTCCSPPAWSTIGRTWTATVHDDALRAG